ncbi:MAG: alkaline phosphatase [Kangiellaceae bacterium]|nr:alkaline phosphatase [Kangiellaceae bacterium]
MIRLISLLCVFFLLLSCQHTTNTKPAQVKPKNIILFIGDGMGPAYLKAYRMIKDDPKTSEVETTLFDSLLVGTIRTDPQGVSGEITDSSASAKAFATGKKAVNGRVTDSAASATAFATGHKTVNGSLSVNLENKPLPTVLEKAKRMGKSTGMVVTSQVYHATPAAFIAHESNRDNYSEISSQFFDNQFQGQPYIDVLLGGGKKYFMQDKRNVSKDFASIGYDIITNKKSLLSSNNNRIVGLFADIGLKKKLDRNKDTPSLADMTRVAISKLSTNDNGFFLMVEGSQIDWAGHENDIVGAMSEMEDFEQALKEALDFAINDKQTQIIVTADHSTGGLSVGATVDGTDYYQWNSDVIRAFQLTPNEIALRAKVSGDLLAEFEEATSLIISEEEKLVLREADPKQHYKALALVTKIVDRQSYTGWTTQGHTGVDVNLYAFGPNSSQLVGHWDNTKIADFIFELLDK